MWFLSSLILICCSLVILFLNHAPCGHCIYSLLSQLNVIVFIYKLHRIEMCWATIIYGGYYLISITLLQIWHMAPTNFLQISHTSGIQLGLILVFIVALISSPTTVYHCPSFGQQPFSFSSYRSSQIMSGVPLSVL